MWGHGGWGGVTNTPLPKSISLNISLVLYNITCPYMPRFKCSTESTVFIEIDAHAQIHAHRTNHEAVGTEKKR